MCSKCRLASATAVVGRRQANPSLKEVISYAGAVQSQPLLRTGKNGGVDSRVVIVLEKDQCNKMVEQLVVGKDAVGSQPSSDQRVVILDEPWDGLPKVKVEALE